VLRDAAEMRKWQCSDTAPLMLIDDGKGYFGAAIQSANVTADSYNVFAAILAEDSHYADMLIEIKLGEPLQVIIARLSRAGSSAPSMARIISSASALRSPLYGRT
jgi:hypothetical protein